MGNLTLVFTLAILATLIACSDTGPTLGPALDYRAISMFPANAGLNSGHGRLFSPLFENGSFEFLSIPEGDRNLVQSLHAVRYRDLRSHHDRDQELLRYAPQKMWDTPCHDDPDFRTFAYGDDGANGRASALAQFRRGDALLFMARLERGSGRG